MKIALVQMPLRADAPTENIASIKNTLKHIKDYRHQIVVFPRLCLSGHLSIETLERPGLGAQYKKVWDDFLKFSKEYPELYLASSQLNFEDNELYGCEEAFIIKDGAVFFCQQRIINSCSYPPSSWPVLEFAGQKIRLLVEDDYLLPGAANEVDILITLKNRPFSGEAFLPHLGAEPKGYWQLFVSQVGGDDTTIYDGGTMVYNPQSKLKGWAYGFDSTVVELDTEAGALPDIEALPTRSHIETLYEALVVGLKDFVSHSGFDKVVLGLSGGIDSAVLAALAVKALGTDKVLAAALPSEFNPPESLALARNLAKNLKINCLTIPITNIKDSFAKAFLMHKKGEHQDIAAENIQSRIRGTIFMYLANQDGRLLLSSSNKSEAAVGYCTLYGDSCGALAPLGDVYKSHVYELARHINQAQNIIPEEIILRAPSAELKPDQKDEDTLPPYEILDNILSRYFEGRQKGSQIAKEGGHSPMTVAWALSAVKKAAFKRTQSPPALNVSPWPLKRR